MRFIDEGHEFVRWLSGQPYEGLGPDRLHAVVVDIDRLQHGRRVVKELNGILEQLVLKACEIVQTGIANVARDVFAHGPEDKSAEDDPSENDARDDQVLRGEVKWGQMRSAGDENHDRTQPEPRIRKPARFVII